jgi:hypothetical protein
MASIKRISVRAAAVLAGVSLAATGVMAASGSAAAGSGPGLAAFLRILRPGVGAGLGDAGPENSRISSAARPSGGRTVPHPGKWSVLNGVFCTSSANCWGVGSYETSIGGRGLNEVVHWNGKKWTQVRVTSPGGKDSSQLLAVRCLTAADCWTVGYYSKGAAEIGEALHWNGKKWSRVATPTPGGTLKGDVNELFDVVCATAANCWAGGEYGSGNLSSHEVILNEVLHWNGKTWSVVHAPDPGGSSAGDVQAIDAIRCPSARHCLAVGTYGNITTIKLLNEALRWNGSKWVKVTISGPAGTTADGDISELDGLGCSSVSNCWAVGSYGDFSTQTYLDAAFHWNGKKWSLATAPNPDGTGSGANNDLVAANCTSATSCWAVGSYGSVTGDTGIVLNLALHWNGKKWTQVKTPEPGGTANGDQDELLSIRCASARRCVAVGEQQKGSGPERNQALRWNGTSWSAG